MFNYKRRIVKTALVFSALIATAGVVSCNRSPEARIDHFSKRIASKLDFNDQQKGLLNSITEQLKVDIKEQRLKHKERLPQIEQMVLGDQLDKEMIKKMMEERENFQKSRFDKYFDKVAELHKTLTPDQKKEIVEKIKDLHEKMSAE